MPSETSKMVQKIQKKKKKEEANSTCIISGEGGDVEAPPRACRAEGAVCLFFTSVLS